jgi:hypothetical protein
VSDAKTFSLFGAEDTLSTINKTGLVSRNFKRTLDEIHTRKLPQRYEVVKKNLPQRCRSVKKKVRNEIKSSSQYTSILHVLSKVSRPSID